MTSDLGLRIGIGLVFAGLVWMVARYRQKAQSGEKFSLDKEGRLIALPLRLGGVALWLYLPAYVLLPDWMAWSTVPVAPALRWSGLAIAALLVPPFVHWAQRSLGRNVTPTVITRKNHELITHGPYRYIRHPLYTAAMVFFLSMSVAAGSWLLPLVMLIVFPVLMARIPKEEAELQAQFGDQYRLYKEKTGRFVPRLAGQAGQPTPDG